MDYRDGQQADRRSEVESSLARGTARLDAEQLGPYTLVAEISSGDFTTVHLAHKKGVHGFDRLVAIKRLKPAFARQPEWSQLLLDEARLGASVDHPNTVDILDVGTDAGVYVVMDYVEGADLEQLLARAGRDRHPRYLVPPLVDALQGLHAIHTQRDELGEPLAMVHQAPRARHILVGVHGNARITDFTQVTARGLIPSTLRGKGLSPAYMAPEQVLISEPVSARTDVFVLGVTFWEALTGERLFQGETPSLVRRAITELDIPKPSEVGLRPPRCFDGICMRALQRNPELRYQTAAEFARDLREVAQEEALLASAEELGQWVRSLASHSLAERRRALGTDPPSQEIAIEVPTPSARAATPSPRVAPSPVVGAPAARPAAAKGLAVPPPPASSYAPVQKVPSAASQPVTQHSSVARGTARFEVDDAALPVAPAITVPVVNRNPARWTKEPSASQRSVTGTLLGVPGKPRGAGLPPPALATMLDASHRAVGQPPRARNSLGRTAIQAPPAAASRTPAVSDVQPAARATQEASMKETLPAGALFGELELPIDLPSAPMRADRFVGFSGSAQVLPDPFVPPPVAGTPAGQPDRLVTPGRTERAPSRAWAQHTAGYGERAEFGGAAEVAVSTGTPNAAAFDGTPKPASDVASALSAGLDTAPPPPPGASAHGGPYIEAVPALGRVESASPSSGARAFGRARGAYSTTPPTSIPMAPPSRERPSEPPLRSSRIPLHQTLDGNVPRDVFERLRPAKGGAESWRPPAQAARQPWPEDDAIEPRRRHPGIFALTAAAVVASVFAYRALSNSQDSHAHPPTPTAVSAPPAAGAPEAPTGSTFDPAGEARAALSRATAPAVAEPEVVPPPVVPPPVVPPPPAVWQAQAAGQDEAANPERRKAAPRVQAPRREFAPRPTAPRATFRASEALPDNPY